MDIVEGCPDYNGSSMEESDKVIQEAFDWFEIADVQTRASCMVFPLLCVWGGSKVSHRLLLLSLRLGGKAGYE